MRAPSSPKIIDDGKSDKVPEWIVDDLENALVFSSTIDLGIRHLNKP